MTFEELLAENGLDPKRASSGRELIIECPFCQRNKLYVNANTGLWLCYRCEERGNKWALLEQVLGIDGVRASYLIRTQLDDAEDAPTKQEPTAEVRPPWLPTGFVTLNRGPDAYGQYMVGRRFTWEHVRRFHVGYAPGNPAYDWRVIIPVMMDGQLQSFVARSIYSQCFRCHQAVCECAVGWQRVLYPPGTKMSELLFNLDCARKLYTLAPVILVEGVFDAMRMPDQAVATFGAHLSAQQRHLLWRHGIQNVIIMFDGDEPGRRAAQRVAQELRSDLFSVKIAHLPDGADPASMTEAECALAVASATPAEIAFSRA